MKIAIISLLFSPMFLLPAQSFAQQSSDNPVAAQAPAQPHARRTAAFQSTLSAVKEFCGKNTDNASCKSDSTEYDAASKLVEKSPELQAYIEKGVLPDKPVKFGSLPAPYKSNALAHQPPTSVGTPSSVTGIAGGQPSIDDSQAEILGLSCEALGRTVLRAVDPKLDVDFPGRGDWENDLCRDRELWKRQYDRYVAHKGTVTEAHERDLASDAWLLLQTRSWEGPALARRFINREK